MGADPVPLPDAMVGGELYVPGVIHWRARAASTFRSDRFECLSFSLFHSCTGGKSAVLVPLPCYVLRTCMSAVHIVTSQREEVRRRQRHGIAAEKGELRKKGTDGITRERKGSSSIVSGI